ncbi:nicotinamide mononucleotide transporter [bacterium]|nr:nicotinamide mononucleotide transporter [bacterium]
MFGFLNKIVVMKNRLSIKESIKMELSGWKRYEILALIFVFTTIFISAIILKDSIIAVISAICGILYTVIAGKGKISCYFFGVCGSGCYSYLAFTNGLYGNLILYMCYYIPMQIFGIFKWKKHLKKQNNEIIKTQLPAKERLILALIAIIICTVAIFILDYLNDAQPVKDGITTMLSVIGMYLTVRRCIEQWVIWMIVNGLSFTMWINAIIHGAKAYATVIMWAFYFAAAIYFYIVWKKEIKYTNLQS